MSSCHQWKLAKEEEEKVGFVVENGGSSKRDRKDKPAKNETKVENTNISSSVFVQKYAVELGVKAAELANAYLYEYIDSWIGVPYKYAGNTKEGVDCSGFVNAVYTSVYKIQLKRSATEIIEQCTVIDRKELREGDLVFFDISSKNSHVGVYLVNDKFIHASSSKGVMISDLNQSYWVKYWGRAARFNS